MAAEATGEGVGAGRMAADAVGWSVTGERTVAVGVMSSDGATNSGVGLGSTAPWWAGVGIAE